jgi:hypothetical protein
MGADEDRDRHWRQVLDDYLRNGTVFDGLHEQLFAHLHDVRARPPAPADTVGLDRVLQRVGSGPLRPDASVTPSSVVLAHDALLAHAALRSPEIGVVVMEVIRDPGAKLVASPLALLSALTAVHGRHGFGRLRRLFPAGSASAATAVPDLTHGDADLIARLHLADAGTAHTVLIARRCRCWIATHDVPAFHRLGYRRTLSLQAPG